MPAVMLLWLAALLAPPAVMAGTEQDIFLVLDNSGSMRKNDPSFLMPEAVSEFIDGLEDETRLGIIIFDQEVRLANPLTALNAETRAGFLVSIKALDYKGQFTNSGNAMERAVYELKSHARPQADKSIVFLTDGIVDTGNKQKDVETSKWMRESLAPDAADAGVRVFGIAFTDNADFVLIQSLAQGTGGEYFRAYTAQDFGSVFGRIDGILNAPPVPEPAPPPTPVAPPVAPAPAPMPEAPSMPAPQPERPMLMIGLVGFVVLAVLLTVLVVLLRRSGGKEADKEAADEVLPRAYLNDIHGITDKVSHEISGKLMMIGRVAGTDPRLTYMVIDQPTVGRQHSTIEYRNFGFWIADQNSVNGTFVNGKKITGETRLKHGDRVKLHSFEFEFVMPDMFESGMTVMSQTTFEQIDSDRTVLASGADALPEAQASPAQEPDDDDEAAEGQESGAAEEVPAETQEMPAITVVPLLAPDAQDGKPGPVLPDDDTELNEGIAPAPKMPMEPQADMTMPCPNHPGALATVRCDICNRSFCKQCISGVAGERTCPTCQETMNNLF